MLAELFYMDTTIWARTPYNKDFVTSLKDKIPKDYRYWDKDEKVWVVSYSYEDEIIALCSTYFDKVTKYGEKRYITTTVQSSSSYSVLHLLPTAPKEVAIAAYRALSKLYHPDVNNSDNATKKMKEINIAFDEVMGRR